MSWFRWMKYVRGERGPRTRREQCFLAIARPVIVALAVTAGYRVHVCLPPGTSLWPAVVVLGIAVSMLIFALEVLF